MTFLCNTDPRDIRSQNGR